MISSHPSLQVLGRLAAVAVSFSLYVAGHADQWCVVCSVRPACTIQGPASNSTWVWCGSYEVDTPTECWDYYQRPRSCIQPPNTFMDEWKAEKHLASACTTSTCK